jgi:hypothetical protein
MHLCALHTFDFLRIFCAFFPCATLGLLARPHGKGFKADLLVPECRGRDTWVTFCVGDDLAR